MDIGDASWLLCGRRCVRIDGWLSNGRRSAGLLRNGRHRLPLGLARGRRFGAGNAHHVGTTHRDELFTEARTQLGDVALVGRPELDVPVPRARAHGDVEAAACIAAVEVDGRDVVETKHPGRCLVLPQRTEQLSGANAVRKSHLPVRMNVERIYGEQHDARVTVGIRKRIVGIAVGYPTCKARRATLRSPQVLAFRRRHATSNNNAAGP